MSELIPSEESGITPVDNARTLGTGVGFDLAKYEERQAEIDGILASRRTPQSKAKELNRRLAGPWDDDFGISYAHISGRELPGLELHGVAEKLAFTGNFAPEANFEGGRLNASVLTGSVLPGLNARRAEMNNVVMPLAQLQGADFEDASMIDSILNFADISDARLRGAMMTGGFLIATLGLKPEYLEDAGDFTSARVLLGNVPRPQTSTESMRDILAARFIDIDSPDNTRMLSPVRILGEINLSGALPDAKNFDGLVLDGAQLIGTRLVGSDWTGSVWHDVSGRRVVLRGVKGSGMVVMNSSLQGADADHLWTPGMVGINSTFRNASIPNANIAGSIMMNSDLAGVDLEGTNVDGLLIVGGKPPELDDEYRSRIQVVKPEELPKQVADNLFRVGSLVTKSSVKPIASIE